MRFRSEQHLRRPADIRAAREQGERVDGRAFTLWWKPQSPATAEGGKKAAPVISRVCVIASGKAVGRAVRRNRAKRRLREVFRQHQAALPAGCDVVMVARATVLEMPMPELGRRFTEACSRIAPPAP